LVTAGLVGEFNSSAVWGAAITFAGLALISLLVHLLRAPVVIDDQRVDEIKRLGDELAGLKALPKPRLEFGGLASGRRAVTDDQGAFVEYGNFCWVPVVNMGAAKAANVWAVITFLSLEDGAPLLPTLTARWSNTDQPDAHTQPVSTNSPKFTRVDIPANRQPEPLDIYVRFSDHPTSAIYAYDNGNHMLHGRGDAYRIEATDNAFLVEVLVRADDDLRLAGVWCLQALTPGPYDIRSWLF